MRGELNKTVVAREAHAAAMRGNDEEPRERTRIAAEEAGRSLMEKLSVFHRKPNRIASDRTTPRKTRASGAQAGSNSDQHLLEMQSLGRGVLGLVKVGKVALQNLGVDTDSIDRILGVDVHSRIR